MARDPNNTYRCIATRKVDGEIEYLVSHTSWSEQPTWAKVFDAQKEAREYLKEAGLKGTVRKYKG